MSRPYAAQVEPQVARALALIDRNPASPTYGCADRAFWQYRTLVDFPGSGWQNLMLGLALVGRTEGGRFHGDANVVALSRAALAWWTRVQHRNGAFDEWYRNEYSYCPTAFTAADAAQTVLVLGDALSADEKAAAVVTLERACNWLAPRRNPTVMNQNLAAALGLWGLWRITGVERWRRAAEDKYALLAAAQSAEGWLPEYGGFDYGYSTLSLDLLAAADRLGAGEHARPMAQRLAGLLDDLAGPGDGLPGRLGCRGTAHLFCHGVEHFAADDAAAARLAARFRHLHDSGRGIGPAQVDDRYFAYFHFPRFALAYAFAPARPPLAVSVERPQRLDRPDAGMVVVRPTPDWQVAVSRRLGGAFAVEVADAAPAYHLGYEIVLKSGKRLSSASWSMPSLDPTDGGTIVCEGGFGKVSGGQPLVRLAVPFHLFTRLLVAAPVAEAFQRLVKALMIKPRGKTAFRLRRQIECAADGIRYRDEIVALPGAPAVVAIHPTADIAVHSPSARQDAAIAVADPCWDAVAAAARLDRDGRLVAEGMWRP